ncbi:IclR family transcriptional regulator [Asaia astilbis]|uniref:IclR family transcriptional regulator n=1 Tax=Asaia astilbis TaxID=610244 RepID=UPI00046F29C1|nr:IclR family transcriptional regulator [Asaia astilbis]
MSDTEVENSISPPLHRAARLLRYIGDGGSCANIRKVSEELDISRSTLLRLLQALEMERFIERIVGDEYRIGIGLISLIGENASGQDLVRTALPIVSQLAEESGLSAHLGVLDRHEVVYLARRVPNVPLASNITVGSRVAAHATTLGRAILANMTQAQVEALYADKVLSSFTSRTPTTLDQLHETLRREHQAGFSESDGILSTGVSSIAAPIFGQDRDVRAAINVTGPTSLFDMGEGRRRKIVSLVTAAANEVSLRLGYHESAPGALDKGC